MVLMIASICVLRVAKLRNHLIDAKLLLAANAPTNVSENSMQILKSA